MVIHMRKALDRIKFILMFLVLTFVLYQMLSVVNAWLEPSKRNQTPTGSAVKVFRHEAPSLDAPDIAERLKLFYWYGE